MIPRQILRELQPNLTNEEFKELFALANRYSRKLETSWQKANFNEVEKYLKLGCKLGMLRSQRIYNGSGINILVSENRDFLTERENFPFQVLNSEAAVKLLIEPN